MTVLSLIHSRCTPCSSGNKRPQFVSVDGGLPQRFEQGKEAVGIESDRIGDFDPDRSAIGGTVNEQYFVNAFGPYGRIARLPRQVKIGRDWPSVPVRHLQKRTLHSVTR